MLRVMSDLNREGGHVCGFCYKATDVSATGDGVRLLISRDGAEATQEVFAHMRCLQARLHPRVPFLPSAFGEDWADADDVGIETVYVELVDEGVQVWRPVRARSEGEHFRVLSTAPDGETWRYPWGSLVSCALRDIGDGPVLVAVALIE